MKSIPIFIGVILCLLNPCMALVQKSEVYTIASPDGTIEVNFKIENGKPFYSVNKKAKPVILSSSLGFEFLNQKPFKEKFSIKKTQKNTFDETWEQPWGEKRFIRNHYNELSVELVDADNRTLILVFRAFNDGVGFRYQIPQQEKMDSIIIMDELTQFNFASEHMAWWIPVHADNSYYESIYRNTSLGKIDTANTPITIETNNGLYLAIHEANLTDYASMTLKKVSPTQFISCLIPWSTGVKVYAKAPMVTPWRIIIIGEKPGDLVASTLMLNLNEPCAIKDLSWVKPSKYIGIWWGMHIGKYTWSQGPNHGATTENTIKYIDFAARHGFDGVLVEGWNYGWDGNWYENGNTFSFTKPYPDFDIEKLASYAASKNVQLIGHHETGGAVSNYERQMEEAFALCQKLGIHYVKTGYVNKFLDGKEWHDSQFGVRHYRKVIETAARYQVNIDCHEPIKPTGLSRTYPNLMSQEGARGQEYDAWSPDGGNPPSHTTILPFTRMLAGPFDFTPGTFNFNNPANPKSRVQTTRAKQLALYVIIYSPLQMASDLPENYEGQTGFDFIKIVPCDWDETKVIDAKIGEFVVMARKDRNSDDWYLGAITNEHARQLKINLNFLDKNATYKATIYSDGPEADYVKNPNDIKVEEKNVTSTDQLNLNLATSGGTAIRFVKIK